MLSLFSTALSALRAYGSAIDTTGHNLANLNTPGFKSSTVSFSELVTQKMATSDAAADTGAGVGQAVATRQFLQGAIQVTGGSLDLAIQGDGFFVVNGKNGETMFTRAGNFKFDKSGYLVTSAGDRVQGWNATSGAISPGGAPTDIRLPDISSKPPQASTKFGFTVNLNASATVGGSDGTFSAPVEVVDSLGTKHTLTAVFTKTGAGAWTYDLYIPAADVGSAAGTPVLVTTGAMTFGPTGTMLTPAAGTPVTATVAGLANGASDIALTWDFYSSSGTPVFTQFDETSAVSATNADGKVPAQLTRTAFTDNGLLMAYYSDGSKEGVAQVALANMRNPDSLVSVGDNYLTSSAATSSVTYGPAGAGGRGTISAGALEASNVDMAKELTNIIMFQRTYQANARAVSTAQELTQEVLNIKR